MMNKIIFGQLFLTSKDGKKWDVVDNVFEAEAINDLSIQMNMAGLNWLGESFIYIKKGTDFSWIRRIAVN